MCIRDRPNTAPAIDSAETVSYILERARWGSARVYPCGAITKGLRGEELCDYKSLRAAGAVAVSDDGRPVEDEGMFERAVEQAAEAGLLTISHCEDLKIIDGGIINKGAISEQLGVRGMDRESEDSITAREISVAERTGRHVHIAQHFQSNAVAGQHILDTVDL